VPVIVLYSTYSCYYSTVTSAPTFLLAFPVYLHFHAPRVDTCVCVCVCVVYVTGQNPGTNPLVHKHLLSCRIRGSVMVRTRPRGSDRVRSTG